MVSRPMEVLLVEDNPDDVDLTVEAIREGAAWINLTVARDGVEALELLRSRQSGLARFPDLVLLDLNLPRKDGREVLSELKADEGLKHLPVVVLTTSQAEHDVLKSYRLHANCYITKPVDFDEFVNIVRTIEDFWFTLVELPSDWRAFSGPASRSRPVD